MENIYLAYALGILTIVFLSIIVGLVKALKMAYKNKSHALGIVLDYEKKERDIYNTIKDLQSNIDDLRGYVDSRVDKLENKLTNNLK